MKSELLVGGFEGGLFEGVDGVHEEAVSRDV